MLCIYHGGCDDGFGAAWVVRKKFGDIEFYPGSYAKTPPDVTGKDVLMVDFSYKRPVLETMMEGARSLLILDHHKTAQEDLAFLPSADDLGAKFRALFDMERSGAGIAWDYFFGPERPRPEFINYLEDRDLWRKALPNGDEFTIALRSYPQDFSVWDRLANNVEALIEEGRSLQRYYRLRVEELKRHAYLSAILNYSCWVANAPYFAASEVAGELCDKPGALFGVCYFEVEPKKYQYSLRSRGDFDVSAIAKEFGGGGHKNAAGFTVNGRAHV